MKDNSKKKKHQPSYFSLGGFRLTQEPASRSRHNELASVDHGGYDRKSAQREGEVVEDAAQLVDQQKGEIGRAGDEGEEGGADRG